MKRPTALPKDANTWGFDRSFDLQRLVYLVRFDIPYPDGGECPTCGDVVRQADKWEKHQQTHRLWRYADTGALYTDGLSQHRLCPCGNLYVDEMPIWCFDCGGYISIDHRRVFVEKSLRTGRIMKPWQRL